MDFVCINVVATHVQLQIGASIVLESSKSLTGRKKTNEQKTTFLLPAWNKQNEKKIKTKKTVV